VVRESTLSSVLSEFARTMVTDFPIQGILDHLVGRIVDVLPVTAAGVTLIESGIAPRYVAASNEAALRFERIQTEIGQGPCVLAFHSGEAVSVPELAADNRFPQFAPVAIAGGLGAVFAFPLRHGAGRLGALDLYRESAGELDPEDMIAAQTLADVAAAYLINAQARTDDQTAAARFEDSALHDPLTGLPNRLLLEQRLDHAAARARREHTSAAVLFADLDRFKAVNDTYGHQTGDKLLVAVGQRLTDLIRPGDTLARVAGDEFVILCEDLSSSGVAEALATRIGAAFMAPFVLDDAKITMTASVGIAYAGPGEEITNQLVASADLAMYDVKRRGGASHQLLDIRDAHHRTRWADRPISDAATAPSQVERLVGQSYFEQARGILMEVHGLTAPEALALITDVAAKTGISPTDLVAKLVAVKSRTTALKAIDDSQ
jgi:diguanylate cyclase (GGDEF)-like protein